jgi:hypothetical protein
VSRRESYRQLCLLANRVQYLRLGFASVVTIDTTKDRRSRTADDDKGKEKQKLDENDVSDLLECALETFQDVSCNGMLSQGSHGNCKR